MQSMTGNKDLSKDLRAFVSATTSHQHDVQKLTITGGKIALDAERCNSQELYQKGIIDKSEYYRNGLNFF